MSDRRKDEPDEPTPEDERHKPESERTDHPAGEEHAARNRENDPPG